MILETEDEIKAFEYVCELANMATDRVCNDLTKEEREKFKNIKVERTEINGESEMDEVYYDFDILHWLKERVRRQ